MELELYSTIEYTPGWYYTKYPKFWNVECYKVMSDYSHHPEKYAKEEQEDTGVEETKDCCMDLRDIDVEVVCEENDECHKRQRLGSK